MDFNFSEEQLAIRDTIRELVQDKVAPRAAEIDEKEEYPRDIEKLFDENVITGSKVFITHGNIAETLIVFARTDGDAGGVTAFVLEREQSPWTVVKLEHKLGIKGSPTAMLAFDEVRVPAANRLGADGQ